MTVFDNAAAVITSLYETLLTDSVDVLAFSGAEDALGNQTGTYVLDHTESARVNRVNEEEIRGGDPQLTRRRLLLLAAGTTVTKANRIGWESAEWVIRSVEPIRGGTAVHRYVAVIEEID